MRNKDTIINANISALLLEVISHFAIVRARQLSLVPPIVFGRVKSRIEPLLCQQTIQQCLKASML